MTLYKYRSFEDFEYFMDLLIKKRLYGATFKELNDPMEGYFISENFSESEWVTMRETKKKVRICSLSKTYDNALMWTHYANDHKGCCIELEVPDSTWMRLEVQYKSTMPKLSTGIKLDEAIDTIFGVKSDFWNYEQEVRYIKIVQATKDGKPFKANLPIRIKKIYLGVRASNKDSIERIVKVIDNNIIVEKLKRDDIKFWKDQYGRSRKSSKRVGIN